MHKHKQPWCANATWRPVIQPSAAANAYSQACFAGSNMVLSLTIAKATTANFRIIAAIICIGLLPLAVILRTRRGNPPLLYATTAGIYSAALISLLPTFDILDRPLTLVPLWCCFGSSPKYATNCAAVSNPCPSCSTVCIAAAAYSPTPFMVCNRLLSSFSVSRLRPSAAHRGWPQPPLYPFVQRDSLRRPSSKTACGGIPTASCLCVCARRPNRARCCQ